MDLTAADATVTIQLQNSHAAKQDSGGKLQRWKAATSLAPIALHDSSAEVSSVLQFLSDPKTAQQTMAQLMMLASGSLPCSTCQESSTSYLVAMCSNHEFMKLQLAFLKGSTTTAAAAGVSTLQLRIFAAAWLAKVLQTKEAAQALAREPLLSELYAVLFTLAPIGLVKASPAAGAAKPVSSSSSSNTSNLQHNAGNSATTTSSSSKSAAKLQGDPKAKSLTVSCLLAAARLAAAAPAVELKRLLYKHNDFWGGLGGVFAVRTLVKCLEKDIDPEIVTTALQALSYLPQLADAAAVWDTAHAAVLTKHGKCAVTAELLEGIHLALISPLGTVSQQAAVTVRELAASYPSLMAYELPSNDRGLQFTVLTVMKSLRAVERGGTPRSYYSFREGMPVTDYPHDAAVSADQLAILQPLLDTLTVLAADPAAAWELATTCGPWESPQWYGLWQLLTNVMFVGGLRPHRVLQVLHIFQNLLAAGCRTKVFREPYAVNEIYNLLQNIIDGAVLQFKHIMEDQRRQQQRRRQRMQQQQRQQQQQQQQRQQACRGSAADFAGQVDCCGRPYAAVLHNIDIAAGFVVLMAYSGLRPGTAAAGGCWVRDPPKRLTQTALDAYQQLTGKPAFEYTDLIRGCTYTFG